MGNHELNDSWEVVLSVTSHINCIVACCLINVVYLTECALSGHDDVATFLITFSALRRHVEPLGKPRDVNKRSQSLSW